MLEAERICGIPIILSPNLHLFKVQWGLHIKNQPLQPPISMQEVTFNLPQILICEELAIIIINAVSYTHLTLPTNAEV